MINRLVDPLVYTGEFFVVKVVSLKSKNLDRPNFKAGGPVTRGSPQVRYKKTSGIRFIVNKSKIYFEKVNYI